MAGVGGIPLNKPMVGMADSEAYALLANRALSLGGRGPYVVQAAVASLHADQPRDLPRIAAHFDDVERRFLGRRLAALDLAVKP